MKKALVKSLLISAFILIFASCTPKYIMEEGETWGTFYHIVYSAPESMLDSVKAELNAIDESLSMFNPNSEISAINSGALTIVSPRFRQVFDIAKDVNELSEGLYDPTIGTLTDLWGFGRKECPQDAPTNEAIDDALKSVGIQDCVIDSDGVIVKKSDATVFDFSSIAKGFGIDCIADMFERNGVKNYMIEIGGEVLAAGVNPKGKPWTIQIDSPEGGMGHERLAIRYLGPGRTALATSGNYRNFKRFADGRFAGHTLSPVTGLPVITNVVGVTVEASSCAYADALATACMALGDADADLDMLAAAHAEGIIVTFESDTLKIHSTPSFK